MYNQQGSPNRVGESGSAVRRARLAETARTNSLPCRHRRPTELVARGAHLCTLSLDWGRPRFRELVIQSCRRMTDCLEYNLGVYTRLLQMVDAVDHGLDYKDQHDP